MWLVGIFEIQKELQMNGRIGVVLMHEDANELLGRIKLL
jgi:hypothetical protein